MSQSRDYIDEVFQEQCSLWEKAASVCADCDFLNFEDLFPEQETSEGKVFISNLSAAHCRALKP